MIARTAVLALILGNIAAMAEDVSPWFGSQASPPTQINLISAEQPAMKNVATSSTEVCPVEGCPLVAKPAKYNN